MSIGVNYFGLATKSFWCFGLSFYQTVLVCPVFGYIMGSKSSKKTKQNSDNLFKAQLHIEGLFGGLDQDWA